MATPVRHELQAFNFKSGGHYDPIQVCELRPPLPSPAEFGFEGLWPLQSDLSLGAVATTVECELGDLAATIPI